MVWSFEVSIQADHHEQKDLSHTLSLSAYCLPVSRLIVKEHNPRRKRPRFDQFQVRPVPISKEPLPAPQHHRVDQQPVVIDQVMLPQLLDKLTAATDQNVLAGLLLQLRDLFRDIPPNRLELFHETSSSVVETTYLGMLFILSPNSPVPVTVGQAAANPW